MRVLGIDPGLDITGYGIVEDITKPPTVITAGVIKTSRQFQLTERLNQLYNQLIELIKNTAPDVCVIEELYSHYRHPMTAILMGHARGVILFCCSQQNLKVIGYPTKTVKRSVTGNGNASKEQVQRVMSKLLHLKELATYVDITDALALCLTHLHHTKESLESIRV